MYVNVCLPGYCEIFFAQSVASICGFLMFDFLLTYQAYNVLKTSIKIIQPPFASCSYVCFVGACVSPYMFPCHHLTASFMPGCLSLTSVSSSNVLLQVTCPKHLCNGYNFMAPFCILNNKITAGQLQQIVILQTANHLLKIKIPILYPHDDIFLWKPIGLF